MDVALDGLGQLGGLAADPMAVIAGLPWPLRAVLVTAPVIVAVLWGSTWSIVGAVLLGALAWAGLSAGDAAGGAPLIAAGAWTAAVIVAMRGMAERRAARASEELAGEIEALRVEMQVFLAALDRRARTVDEARSGLLEVETGSN